MAAAFYTMGIVIIFLALFLMAAVAFGIVLYIRLRKKEDQMDAVFLQQSKTGFKSDPYELAAIDQLLYDRTCRYMTDKRPFLVPGFTLQDLANAVYTNKYYLSKTINRFSGKNFRQYVNYYRVMYSMELYRANRSLRVTEMASLSGFHSITSYTASFKKVMGETPSDWCARMRKKNMETTKKTNY